MKKLGVIFLLLLSSCTVVVSTNDNIHYSLVKEVYSAAENKFYYTSLIINKNGLPHENYFVDTGAGELKLIKLNNNQLRVDAYMSGVKTYSKLVYVSDLQFNIYDIAEYYFASATSTESQIWTLYIRR